ncbi:hypothetical protein FQN53_000539 [Emmonsiellopsis sp. PD_33]|nr:hypothetical protein FQN53_000539 [Emmonsiellopsis sp. PD_33]
MSGYQPTHGPGGRLTVTIIGDRGSSLSPGSAQPPSFKTNVNRQKTKRWVNAKSYSYDGDDWGDSEDEEIEDSPPPPPSQPTPAIPSNRQENKPEPARIPTTSGAGQIEAGKPLPFIRPADIYKRMAEEKEKQRQQETGLGAAPLQSSQGGEISSDSPQTTTTLPLAQPNVGSSPTPDITQPRVSVGDSVTSATVPEQSKSQLGGREGDTVPNISAGPPSHSPSSPSGPLDGPQKRDSGEGTPEQQSTAGETGLHHNPSLGFRSVVHQAFDVAETPSTTTGSIDRSNSDSTSTISPIIRSNTSSTFADGRGGVRDQTPTIQEEPLEFKPGHRRSMTPPRSGTSPARRPVVASLVDPPKSYLGDVSDDSTATPPNVQTEQSPGLASPTESSPDTPRQTIARLSVPEFPDGGPNVPEEALPTPPSKEAASVTHLADPVVMPHSEIPRPDQSSVPDVIEPPNQPPPAPPKDDTSAMPPALKLGTDRQSTPTTPGAPENTSPSSPENPSPHVNDRLRDEIMQSLSPRASVVPQEQPPQSSEGESSLEPRSRIRYESTLIPSEYDIYWNETAKSSRPTSQDPDTSDPLKTPVNPETEKTAAGSDPTGHPVGDAPSAIGGQENPQPRLKKRFSWEESSVENDDGGQPQRLTINPNVPEEHPRTSLDDNKTPTAPEHNRGSQNIDQTISDIEPSQATSASNAPVTGTDPSPHPGPEDSRSSPTQSSQPSASQEPRVPGFREIMAIKAPEQKIKTFDQTREQFATMDTGLSAWIKEKTESLSDHSDVVERNGLLPPGANLANRPAPRNKFAKLGSLGSLSLQPSHQEGSTPTSGHTRQHSGTPLSAMMNSQQVQAKGKDFLHSAGVLGGKAGGAAKGLFAKGRSKFRNSGSADKVNSSPARKGPVAGVDTQQPAPASGSQDDQPKQTTLPRLLSLKLDPVPFSNSMSNPWEEPTSTSPKAAIPTPAIPPEQERDPSPTPPSPGHASLKSALSVDKLSIQDSNPINHSVERSNEPSEVNDANTSKNSAPLNSEETRPRSPTTAIPRPMSTAEHSITDNRVSSVMMSDDSSSIAAPVEEARAIKLIGRKASVIHPDSHVVISRRNELTKHENTSTVHIVGPTRVTELEKLSVSRANAQNDGESVVSPIGSAPHTPVSNVPPRTPTGAAPSTDAREQPQIDRADSVSPFNSETAGLQNSTNDTTPNKAPVGQHDEAFAVKTPPPDKSKALPALPVRADDSSDEVVTDQEHEIKNQEPSDSAPDIPKHQTTKPAHDKHNGVVDSDEPDGSPSNLPSNQVPANINGSTQVPAVEQEVAQPSASAPAVPQGPEQDQIATAPVNGNIPTQPMTPAQDSSQQASEQPSASSRPKEPIDPPPAAPQQGETIREFYGPSSNPPQRPSVQDDVPRPGSAMAGFMSKVPFGRQAERRGSATGQTGEKSWSSRFQAFKFDSVNSKSRNTSALASAPTKPAVSPPASVANNANPASSKAKMSTKFIRSASRLAHDADEMRKKNIPRITGLFNRSQKPAQSPAAAQTQPKTRPYPGYHDETNITALPQRLSQTYPGGHQQNQPGYQQQFPSGQPHLQPQYQTVPNHSHQPNHFYTPAGANGYRQSLEQARFQSLTHQPTYAPHNTQAPILSSQPASVAHFPTPPNSQAYAANLRLNSRIPSASPPPQNSNMPPATNTDDPAYNLGTFRSSVPNTPRVGDQERPWNISLPGEDQDKTGSNGRRTMSQASDIDPTRYPLPDSANMSPANPSAANTPPPPPPKLPLDSPEPPATSPAAVPAPPSHSSPAVNGVPQPSTLPEVVPDTSPETVPSAAKQTEPAELPVPFPGDDSSEEIIMSSTSYPGQEWQPTYPAYLD